MQKEISLDRLKFAGHILKELKDINTVLDVGCREGLLRSWLPDRIRYFGNDLFQNSTGTVDYVGDISNLDVASKFDVIVALDILEHVEQPSIVFDKLYSLANVALVVSLPNCYGLKSRLNFAFNGQLGGKYEFTSALVMDRHRWIMSRPEIIKFYLDKGVQHGSLAVSTLDMKYGDPNGKFISKLRSVFRILPLNLCTETVFGVFVK